MVKTVSISFTDRNNAQNAFQRLDVGRALLTFSEFDFTFFWETAIDAGRTAKRTGKLPKVTVDNARASISKCHPYVAAGITTDYADVVLDCIIEYICRSERMTEDELWTRCISSKIPYETAIFKRISEYKTFKGANQWRNITGLQKYVKDKITFIYGSDSVDDRNNSIRAHTLKQYFDLSFAIAANECAVPKKALPAVKLYSPCLAPTAAFSVSSSAAKALYKRMEEALAKAPDRSDYEKYDTSRLEDRFAVESYAFAAGLPRPKEPDEELFRAATEALPDSVYVASSLKGMIDLEFDLMETNGIHFRQCEMCKRFFLINATGFDERFCDRVNSSGTTCRRIFEAENAAKGIYTRAVNPVNPDKPGVLGYNDSPDNQDSPTDYSVTLAEYPAKAFEKKGAAVSSIANAIPAKNAVSAVSDVHRTAATDDEPAIVDKTEYFPELGETVHIQYSAPKRDYPPGEVPEEEERHGQRLYNSIYKRVGKSISEHEVREWSHYLSNMNRTVKTGEGSVEQLNEFLSDSDKLADEIKRAARQKRSIPREPVARLARYARMTDNMHAIGNIPFPDYSIETEPTDNDYRAYFAPDEVAGGLKNNPLYGKTAALARGTAPVGTSDGAPPHLGISDFAEPPEPPVELIRARSLDPEDVTPFAPDAFDPAVSHIPPAADGPGTSFRSRFIEEADRMIEGFTTAGAKEIPGGNVKVKDLEPVEIDGRKATLGNPVWERVARDSERDE
jgi:hypothetical protein